MSGCVYINPDIIAQEEYPDWKSTDSIIKAANKARELREKCLAQKTSIAFETVFSTPEKLRFVQHAKEQGFFVRLFFICTNDPSINAQRVAMRIMAGGHDVPIPKIINRYYRSVAYCMAVLQWIDRAYFYDNSVNDADPRLMFRVANGKIIKIYGEIAPWSQSFVDTLPQA